MQWAHLVHKSWSLVPYPLTGIGAPKVMNGTSVGAGQSEPAEELVSPESKSAQESIREIETSL